MDWKRKHTTTNTFFKKETPTQTHELFFNLCYQESDLYVIYIDIKTCKEKIEKTTTNATDIKIIQEKCKK